MKSKQRQKKLFGLFKMVLAINFLQTTSFAQMAPNYNPDQHFFKNDENTGYNIGQSLYDIKINEMKIIVKKVIDEVNAMDEQAVFKYAKKNNITDPNFQPESGQYTDWRQLVKVHKVEQAVEDRNMQLIQKMNSSKLPTLGKKQAETRVRTISDQDVLDTSISINYSPASDHIKELKEKYDPQGNFGFCFLRAHYYANAAGQRGLVKESIKKVFVVGTMMPLGAIPIGTWQFHVATAVRGDSTEWKVLDSHLKEYQEKASSVSDWYRYYNEWLDTPQEYTAVNHFGQIETVKAKALFLFFTDPGKIGASSNAYNRQAFYGVDLDSNGQLEGKEIFYNGLFMDVDKHLADSKLSVCDPDRYKPLPADHARCNSVANQNRKMKRTETLNHWRAIWNKAFPNQKTDDLIH